MRHLKTLIGTTRPSFLLLTPACISLGIGTAYWQSNQLESINILLVFIGALSAHISVNVFNEYFDFRSGLDAATTRTPFSGGSGSLQTNPEALNVTLGLAIVTLLISAVIGTYFVLSHGFGLLPLGLLGLALVVTYTTWWVYHPILCLMAPGLGFGLLMINGTHYVLTESYSLSALVASLVPSFLVSNLLLLNQFPDVEADRSIGRRHFPMTKGLNASTKLYGLFFILAYLPLIVGIAYSLLPMQSAIALVTGLLALKSYLGVKQNANDTPALLPFMGMNVGVNLLTPLLMAIGFYLARP